MQEYIDDFLQYQLEVKKKSSNTLVSLKRDIVKMVDFFVSNGITDIRKINETQLNSYMLYLERLSLSSATICRYISSIKVFFYYLMRTRVIESDPTEQLKGPKINRKKPEYLSLEQIDILLSQPDETTHIGLRDKAMLELLYATGIKVSELIQLETNDIDVNVGCITCVGSSGERRIPMGTPAIESLNAYIKRARISFIAKNSYSNPNEIKQSKLFMNYTGSSMSRQSVWKMIKKYADKAGITEDVTPQLLRHSFAVHMIQNGADLKTLQEILGHSDVAITEMYSVFTDSKIRDVYKNVHPRSK